jgi:predicted DNA-binding transcriptional regulator YafY
VVEPVAVEGGYVNAYDHLRGATRSFAIHRITGVSPLDDEDDASVS